jgi:predicted GNAT family acetyltransferase
MEAEEVNGPDRRCNIKLKYRHALDVPNREQYIVAWGIFRRKARLQQKVTTGRFEIERNGEIAYLEYSLSGNVLALMHTEVPEKLRGLGLASSLAETALHWAHENNLKVDVVCPSVQAYMVKHPEYSDLVMR